MKTIKFDLAIDGFKVTNIYELREHFTVEILDHYRSGRLGKWLSSRSLNMHAAKLTDLDEADENILLKNLCDIFEVASDDASLQALYEKVSIHSKISAADCTPVYDLQTSSNTSDFVEAAVAEHVSGDTLLISDAQLNELLSADNEENIKELLNDIKSKKIPKPLQVKLIELGGETVKIALANNPLIDEEVQLKLAIPDEPKVREALAANLALSQSVQIYLITSGSNDVKIFIAQNEAIVEEVQKMLVDDENWQVREALAKNSSLGMSCQSRLVNDDDADVKAALASNSALLEEFQEKLFAEDDEKICTGLAKNINLKENIMIKFARDSSEEIKKSLAGNCSLPDFLQAKLINSNCTDVKIELAKNKSLTIAKQIELSKSMKTGVLIALFDNPSLDEEVRKKIIPKISERDLEDTKKEQIYTESELKNIDKKRMETYENINKLIYGSSLFNPMDKIDRLQSEIDKLEKKEHELRNRSDLLFSQIEKLENILTLKKI